VFGLNFYLGLGCCRGGQLLVGVWGLTLPSAQPGVTAPLPVMLVVTCEGLPL
jgi:hypothetical protein